MTVLFVIVIPKHNFKTNLQEKEFTIDNVRENVM